MSKYGPPATSLSLLARPKGPLDAITGSFDRIDIKGLDGRRLKDEWSAGPQTYLGILVEGFPNMLMVMGPHAGLGGG